MVRSLHSIVRSNVRSEYWYIPQLAPERYGLAFESLPNPHPENSFGGHGGAIGQLFECIVVLSERDKMRRYAEKRIVVEDKRVRFTIRRLKLFSFINC